MLNPLDEIDLFVLHYVYLNVINHHIVEWVSAWNNHKMSSSHNSPIQQWIEGFQHMSLSCIEELLHRQQIVSLSYIVYL